MKRCAVDACGEAAWTTWRNYDLGKPCSEAASVWDASTTSIDEADAVLARIAKNLRMHGTRTGPDQ
ncbi:MAG TPA: hypothetical protein VGR43_10385 [Dehalococcoidia bacterium]|nr:hypothetical protein [Dehalococcoidia bacterium]